MTEHAYHARLSLAECAEIRKKRATPCECCGHRPTLRELGEKYGVSNVAIYKLLSARRWGEPA